MKRITLVAGILFLAFSLVTMKVSWSMEYYSSLGPGPGFFPFWLGLLMAILSMIWIVQTLFGKSDNSKKPDFLPSGAGLFRVLSILGSLFLMVLLMEVIGFQLSMFAFLIFLLVALGKVKVWLTLVVAAVGSFGLNYVFTTWLDVQLPLSSIPLLAGIGL